MDILHSKPRAKVLFAVCQLNHLADLPYVSNIARVTDQNRSNVSRYAKEWNNHKVFDKTEEESHILYKINDKGLVDLYFDFLNQILENELGTQTFENSLEVLGDEKLPNAVKSLLSESANDLAQPGVEKLQSKYNLIQYIRNKKYTTHGVLQDKLSSYLKAKLRLPLTQNRTLGKSILAPLEAVVGEERAKQFQGLIDLAFVFEGHLENVDTTSKAFEIITNHLLYWKPETKPHEEIQEFLTYLRSIKIGNLDRETKYLLN